LASERSLVSATFARVRAAAVREAIFILLYEVADAVGRLVRHLHLASLFRVGAERAGAG
jgi:hypothetical protein